MEKLGLPTIDPAAAGQVLAQLTGQEQGDPMLLFGSFLVILARIVGFMTVAPFFGSANIPVMSRVGFAAMLSVVLAPMLLDSAMPALLEVQSEDASGLSLGFTLLLVNQVLVGVMLGFVGAFVFYAIESAGRVIDTQRGSNITDVIAPQTGERTSPTGQWLMMVALMLLLVSGQHMLILDGFIRSFEVFPATSSLDWIGRPTEAGEVGPLITKFVELSGQSLLITVQVAAPAMISLMLTDILLGIINRGAPQVNVFSLSQVVKGPIGLAAVFVALIPMLGFINDTLIPYVHDADSEYSIHEFARYMAG